jgi:2'-hydroxyisoflavone reductase
LRLTMAMKLLVIGGTRFLGRHFVEAALAAGHDLTLLNRGRSNASLFADVEQRRADRNGDLAVLDHGHWDAVLDFCAYVPRHVSSLTRKLGARVERYLLVSSVSAYASLARPGPDEDAPVAVLSDPGTETVDGDTYGGLKALCEQTLHTAWPGRALVARPGLIVGPWDPTGRFTWWVRRIAAGGDVLAPGDPTGRVQFIDARDAAAWLLRQTESKATGTFNLAGPARPVSLGDLLETTRQTLRPAARLHWASEDFLLAEGVQPWSQMPLWVPQAEAGLNEVDIGRALQSGLVTRPVAQIVADTAAWAAVHDGEHAGVGLTLERERDLLMTLAKL